MCLTSAVCASNVGFYPNTNTRVCAECDVTCKTCSWSGADKCTSCKSLPSRFLYETTCVEDCFTHNDGYWSDTSD